MRSQQLEASLTDFFVTAGAHLRAEVAGGAEVPFEVGAQGARRSSSATLYCYRALTGEFIASRESALRRLPAHAEALKQLGRFDGLERYLASVGGEAARAKGRGRVQAALTALLEDVFDGQSEFELRRERVQAALERLQDSTLAKAGELAIVASLHGVTIASEELPLTKGLRILQRDALRELPDAAAPPPDGEPAEDPLLVLYTAEPDDPAEGLRTGRAVLEDLLSALRLFGDGRVTLGALAWARFGSGTWTPLALGAGGRPHGMLVITPEHEDELRAFCNLVSRRAPHDNDLAWALRRFELGCERETPYEGLTDNLLALRALLEPEGPASARLAGRLAALCATAEQRSELTERMTRAIALERSLIAGTAAKNATSQSLAEDVANHLRSLLRDVICGHLDPDLAVIADELLEPDELLHADEDSEAEEVAIGAQLQADGDPDTLLGPSLSPAMGAASPLQRPPHAPRARRVRKSPLKSRLVAPRREEEPLEEEDDFIGAHELAAELDAHEGTALPGDRYLARADGDAPEDEAPQAELPIDGVVSTFS
ncbi:MAG TPA: hypothetical protein VN672_12715 [Solirubrobacteraceae bacterium]|nr:hypothetical protein [Solirubrobacteraceae bacterium]